MRYAVWNNKGGVGKTFLSFVLSTEYAERNPDKKIVVVDMCPQANLSEIFLGGNGKGEANVDKILSEKNRKTIGGYFDKRIESPHSITGDETSYGLLVNDYNKHVPPNIHLICGDPSLEIQAQVMNQISSQTLPIDAWKNVHNWLKDVILACVRKLGDSIVFIDCNPSFCAYSELAMVAAERIIVPCSSDGSSARAIDNLGSLIYGIDESNISKKVGFFAKSKDSNISLPLIHSIILNRSTQYRKDTSKAFAAMFNNIKDKAEKLKDKAPQNFTGGEILFEDMPDSHSVAVVCSHHGMPLKKVAVGKYQIHDIEAQVNESPLERYKTAINKIISNI